MILDFKMDGKKGLHIIANFFSCKEKELLLNKGKLEKVVLKIVEENGLDILKYHFHKFDNAGGITGFVLVSESHVSIHTWPEKGNYIALDIFVCNYTKNNNKNAKKILQEFREVFKPEKVEEKFIKRN